MTARQRDYREGTDGSERMRSHLRNARSLSFSIYHFPFAIYICGLLLVFVRVISWIVFHLLAEQAIHEVSRNEIQEMANEKC